MSIGPLSAGIFTDNFGMRAPYFFGTAIGILSALAFVALDRFAQRSPLPNWNNWIDIIYFHLTEINNFPKPFFASEGIEN